MWTEEERAYFELASYYAGNADYRNMLRVSKNLLSLVQHDPIKTAYARGCREAVALRHLGRTKEAHEAFEKAYKMTLAAKQPVIASFILNDWASMSEADEAIGQIKEAIRLRKQGVSPDSTRSLAPDIAYFEAHKARMLARQGKQRQAASLIASASRALKRFARHEAYKNAYLVVLVWELEMHKGSRLNLLRLAPSVLLEVARQGKFKATVRLLKSPERKQINPSGG